MTTAPAPRTVDLYVRTSRKGDRDAGSLHTLEDQIADARRFVESRPDLIEGEVFRDIGSGGDRDRAGLQAALTRVRAGVSSGIVVAYLSRLTREGGTALGLFAEIHDAGGEVFAPSLPADQRSADGRFMIGVQLLADANVRERAIESTRKARTTAITSGVAIARYAPPGYDRGPDKRLVPNADAEHVREAFRMRLRGIGPARIADFLTDAGVRSGAGHRITVATALDLLARRTYLGEVFAGDLVNTAAHPPIIDAEIFDAVQALAGRNRDRPRRGSAFYMLSGIVECASCGAVMSGTTYANHGGTRHRYYRCSGRGVVTCAARARVRADVVESEAVEYLLDTFGAHEATVIDPPDVEALRAAVAAADRRLAQALSEDAQDALGDAWAGVVRDRRSAVGAARAALSDAVGENARSFDLVALRDAWEAGEIAPEEQRRLLRLALLRVTVSQAARGKPLLMFWPRTMTTGRSQSAAVLR